MKIGNTGKVSEEAREDPSEQPSEPLFVKSRAQFLKHPPLDDAIAAIKEQYSLELITEVTELLKLDWFIEERDQYRFRLEKAWSPPDPIHLDHNMIFLDCTVQRRKHPSIPCIDRWRAHELLNKATTFYWMQSAYNDLGNLWQTGVTILGGIENTWIAALGRRPQVQLDEFFAAPVSIGEEYATTIQGVLHSHKYICVQIREFQEKKRAGDTSKLIEIWPDLRYFKLHPLCEALITVFDEYNHVVRQKHADGYYYFDDVAEKQSILLVRTGNEDGLSAPITFDSLRNEALPLATNEKLEDIDIIRIPLKVGVRFVANLWLREEAAFPERKMGGLQISKEPDHPVAKWEREAREWAEEQLARAHQKRKISPTSTAASVKAAVLLRRLDQHPPEYYAPYTFRLGWI